jgi:hypothetical protein
MRDGVPSSLPSRVWQSALVLLGTAMAARVAYEALEPIIPMLVVAAILAALLGFIVRPGRFYR